MFGFLKKLFGDDNENEIRRMEEYVERINALEPAMKQLSDASLAAKTVEFRQHSGTTSFTKMRNWVLFLHKLVTFATRGQVPAGTALQDIPFLDGEQKLYYKFKD